MHAWGKPTLTTLLVLSALAAPVAAKTLYVENNGVDGPHCGARRGACRSISQAVGNAVAGDRIVVGPGRYGDIDGDNAFTTPGDEAAQVGFGCECLLRVDKPVRIVSAQGASATVLSPGTSAFDALVVIAASGATFGEPDQGFFVGSDPFHGGPVANAGIRTGAATDGVYLGGNVVLNAFAGFQLRGTAHTVEYNRATGNDRGFAVAGADMTLRHNVAMGNEDGILVTAGGAWLLSNAVIANRTMGIALLRGQQHRVRRSAVLGNPGGGIQVDTFCPGPACRNVDAAVLGNDLFGNIGPALFGSPGAGNCAIVNAKQPSLGPLDARGNYWGLAIGAGPDPGDVPCNLGTSSANQGVQYSPAERGLDLAPQH